MRKIVLLFVSLCFMMKMYAQDKVFVIFTSTKSEVKGVWNFVSNDYRVEKVWDAPHYFTLFDRAGGIESSPIFICLYIKMNGKRRPAHFLLNLIAFWTTLSLLIGIKFPQKVRRKRNTSLFYRTMKYFSLIEKNL